MSRKGIYRASKIKNVEFGALVATASRHMEAAVGLDIAKREIVVVIRWPDGSFERPICVVNPFEIGELMDLFLQLRDVCPCFRIALESTGTYGEAVRHAMTKHDLEVHRVSGKAVSDYREIFDGVPSQHDGKDAAMIAELASFGKGTLWAYEAPAESQQERKRHVARLASFQKQGQQWLGRLEGLLAKHWPELSDLLDLTSATLLNICMHYGSPLKLAEDEAAHAQLRKWGGPRLTNQKIQTVLASARSTLGIPLRSSDESWLKEVAGEAHNALQQEQVSRKALKKLAKSDPTMSRYVDKIGATTLCTIWDSVGDPHDYASSGAFLKALGLNLKELSSGKRKGELAITKRGPSQARRILYFWALRAVQQPELKSWYFCFKKVGRSKSGKNEHRAMKGLIALMRKLARALWYVRQHDLPFSYAKVFPNEPLQKRTTRRRRKPTSATKAC